MHYNTANKVQPACSGTYALLDPNERYLENTPAYSRIQEHWNTHMYREASVKSSLRFLSEDTLNVTSSSRLALGPPLQKSFIKARIMTGTYKLQAHESMYNQ